MTSARLAALCALALVAFSYPALAVANRPGAGWPVLAAYLFGVWAAVIVAAAVVAERGRRAP